MIRNVSCKFCNSTRLKRYGTNIDATKSDYVYFKIECLDCGAVGDFNNGWCRQVTC